MARRRNLIEVAHPQLSLVRQCQLVGIARSSFYYQPGGESEFNLLLMRLIDEQYLRTPWYGSRQMKRHLRRQGYAVNRKRIARLMTLMGLMAVVPGPHTSKPHPQHPVYPYLLRGLTIDQPDQVWCADVTYIPMAHGFIYLVAIMDWFSRRVLSWRLTYLRCSIPSTPTFMIACSKKLEPSLPGYPSMWAWWGIQDPWQNSSLHLGFHRI